MVDHKDWQRFEGERDALVSRMEMATCDGCDGCGLRCTDGFTITLSEWKLVEEFLKTVPLSEVQRVKAQQKTVPWPGAEETGATVTFCRFRDNEAGNCSIYPARPTICRLFGHTRWLPCPIEAVSSVPDGAEVLWEQYRGFERRTFAEWEASTQTNEGARRVPDNELQRMEGNSTQ